MPSTLMIIDPGVQLWGSERALEATLESLAAAWTRVVLVTPPGAALARFVIDRGLPDCVELDHAPIAYLHKRGWGSRLWAMLSLARLMLKHRPGRIYLNQAGLCRLLVPLARIARVPLVIHIRLLEDVARVAPLRGRKGSPIHKIFISDAMLETQPSHNDACTHVHNAYDPFVFAPDRVPVQRGSTTFVSVGRLSHGKGQHLLVEATAALAAASPGVHVIGEGVAGDAYPAQLRERVKELALGEHVDFLGFRHDVAELLGSYRFLVSTSRYEPLGRVVMEAWEAGVVPIVYAGSGGAAEIVRKSGGGLLYDHWTPASLATALQSALEMSGAARNAMAKAGLEWGKAHLGIETYKARLRSALY